MLNNTIAIGAMFTIFIIAVIRLIGMDDIVTFGISFVMGGIIAFCSGKTDRSAELLILGITVMVISGILFLITLYLNTSDHDERW